MAQSSITPAMLQQWIAQQQAAKAMPGVPMDSSLMGMTQQMPGAPNVGGLSTSLMDMIGGQSMPQMMSFQPKQPMGLLDMMGGSQADPTGAIGNMQMLPPPAIAMMASQAPMPAGVPSFRRPAPVPAMPSKALQEQRRAKADYSIKKGDTLSAIAKRNGTTVKALLAKNPQIKNANRIFVGDKINL